MNTYIELWMSVVGLAMALSCLPQLYRIYKLKSSREISLTMYSLLLFGQLNYFFYGVHYRIPNITIVNLICVLFTITTIIMIFKYRKPNLRRSCDIIYGG